MKKPLVSIIIPNFNSSEHIEATIASIAQQSYINWELIIVDDCSTDNSVQIIKKWEERHSAKIFLYQLPENSGGPAAPRNHALKKAKGAYIAFIDSDDVWHPSKLTIQIKMMISKNWDFTCTKICEFSDDDELINYTNSLITKRQNQNIKIISHSQMLLKNRIRSGSTSIVKKSLLDKFDISFNTENIYVAVEDYLFWLDILRKSEKQCFRIEIPLTFYRISPTSISQGKLKMAKKIFNLLNKYPYGDKKTLIKKHTYFITYFFFSLADKLKNKKCSRTKFKKI